MSFDFSDLIDILDGEEFEEKPVDLRTFVNHPNFLGLPPLSEYQYTLIEKSSQIYKESTLKKLFGDEEGSIRFKQTANEVVAQLGKGSGKDYCSTIAVAYIVYLLLCLKDPATYYGKPPGDSIDIINIAINSQQASNVFFKGFRSRIDKSPWFVGKYYAKASEIQFDKAITVHSGHSEREAWEGYNVIVVILDEISGFAIENTTGHDQAKTGSAVYDMYRASVDSRFPDFGKVILLSFPRFKNDYIQQRYDAVIGEKETVIREHKFKMYEEIPDGTEGNEFEIQWEEDHIISYKIPKVYAIKRPTWEINPVRKIDDFKTAFYTNPTDALSRLTVQENESIIESITMSMNAALREIGMFQDMYDGIKKNNNIPDNWDEKQIRKNPFFSADKDIVEVAKLSFSEEFINKLPNKYDTIIGENGVRLSGGEKQRLSIARAMLKKSQIILLDEATSSLDAETENKIQEAISFLTKDRTTIVIAHRLSTILKSDKIYVIDNGLVVGDGNHNELLKNSEIYKNFYEKQLRKI